MAVTDYKSAGTITNEPRNSKEDWINPTNAGASDNARAICDVKQYTYGDWLRCVNFGFTTEDIPSGHDVDGIEVKIERQSENSGEVEDSAIYVRIAAGQTGDNKADDTGWQTDSDEEVTRGGAADDWNWEGDDAEVRASTFGVDISAANGGFTSAREARVDHVQIRVYHSEAAPSAVLPGGMDTYRRRRV